MPIPTIGTEGWPAEELEWSGRAVKITSYRVGDAFLTEVESLVSGATIARGVARSKEDSRNAAFQTAARRLLRNRYMELMVGG